MTTEKLTAGAEPDQVWSGRLWAEGARPGRDDPVWGCDHEHRSEEQALECSRREIAARSFKSRFAREVARVSVPDQPEGQRIEVLQALDPILWKTEQELAGKYGESGHPAIMTICRRIVDVYENALAMAGMAAGHGTGTLPPPRTTWTIAAEAMASGDRVIMRVRGDERTAFLTVPAEGSVDALSAIRTAYDTGRREIAEVAETCPGGC